MTPFASCRWTTLFCCPTTVTSSRKAASQAQAPGQRGQGRGRGAQQDDSQGISALLALNPHSDLAHNLQFMTAALKNVETGEVTVAVQDAHFDGIEVRAGR